MTVTTIERRDACGNLYLEAVGVLPYQPIAKGSHGGFRTPCLICQETGSDQHIHLSYTAKDYRTWEHRLNDRRPYYCHFFKTKRYPEQNLFRKTLKMVLPTNWMRGHD
jgi:hypothetical protein